MRDVKEEIRERDQLTYAEQRRKKRFEAAAQLEELIAVAKQVVLDLRGEPNATARERVYSDDTAYGRVYWLRTQLGYVVAKLGYGAPATWVKKVVGKEYGTLLTRLEKATVEGKGE